MNNLRSGPSHRSDAYAQYVIDIGSQFELTADQLQTTISNVGRAIEESRGFLISPYTSNAIQTTLISVIFSSRVFRRILAFSAHENHRRIEEIRYQNRYELTSEVEEDVDVVDVDDSEVENNFIDIYEITAEDIECSTVATTPITMITEAFEREYHGNIVPYVNISPAPNTDTQYYPFWQEALIHEIIHHITGSGDPLRGENRLGPTEILARQVADEMDWPIPIFSSYYDPERERAVRERDFRSLIHTLHRNSRIRGQIMGRLSVIGDGAEASVDFDDLDEQENPIVDEELLPPPDFDKHHFPHFGFDKPRKK